MTVHLAHSPNMGSASGRWQAQLSHYTGPHTHTSQGDSVEPALQAVVAMGTFLVMTWPPVEDGLVVVEWY